jgi:hypothetical protein
MVQFRPRERRNVGGGSPHRWKSFPRLERPGCEAGHSPSSSTEVCSATCLHGVQRDKLTFTSRNKRGGYTKTITCTVSRIVAALYCTEDSPHLHISQSVQSKSHKIKRKFFQNCHSVTVDISQYYHIVKYLLSNVSLRSVML